MTTTNAGVSAELHLPNMS